MLWLGKSMLPAGFIVFVVLLFGSFSQSASAACASGDTCAAGPGCASGYTVVTGATCTIGTAPGICCTPNIPAATSCVTAGGNCVSGTTCPGSSVSNGNFSCPTLTDTCCTSPGTGTPPAGGGTGTPPPNSQTIQFANPLSYNDVDTLLTSILGTLQGIIVIIALVFIVIGAVLYITSAGDEGRMKTAKGAITASMIGLAIGIAAPSFLQEIGTVLGWGAVNTGPIPSTTPTLTQIAANVLDFLLSIVGILAIIMLVVGGIMYLTAAGDEDRIDTGKKIVKYSIIGIIVALASLVIVTQIANFF